MNKLICSMTDMPRAAWLLAAAGFGSLAFAFVMQYGFGYEPCILCLLQRVPLALLGFAALAAALWRPYGKKTRLLLLFCAFAMVVETGLAAFHTGVERHWWLGTSGCSIQPAGAAGADMDALRERLLNTIVARCDQISWSFLGLSMANYNIPFALGLMAFALIAALRIPAGPGSCCAAKPASSSPPPSS